jgi:hypothetical protein
MCVDLEPLTVTLGAYASQIAQQLHIFRMRKRMTRIKQVTGNDVLFGIGRVIKLK